MTDEEIRAALLGAEGFVPFSVPDHVVVSRDRVEGDLDEIDGWVRDRSGWTHTHPGYQSQQVGGGPWQRPRQPASLWYVVPASALNP